MKRRDFIKLSVFTASSVLLPIEIKAKQKSSKTLILVEFDGGNDGLNTLVPFKEQNYYRLRPTLALKEDEINKIHKNFGLNKNLDYLSKLYKENDCAIIQGLGYDKPNLSHFRSIEIVETASDSNEYLDRGWLSEELKRYDLNDIRPANAVLLGRRKRGHLFSSDLNVLRIKNINHFIKKSSNIKQGSIGLKGNQAFDFLRSQENIIQKANNSLKKYAKDINIKTSFEDTNISNSFKEAAKLIKSKIDIPVIKISQKGYDTHSNQAKKHETLLSEFDNALKSFVEELKKENLFNSVLIMTYSEFGRRVKENGSGGTDHGTASCQFVIGGRIKGGIYGKAPSLVNLKKNNLIYTTHYRSYYNTVLKRWFGSRHSKFNDYEELDFL